MSQALLAIQNILQNSNTFDGSRETVFFTPFGNIFTRLSVFGSPEGSSDIFKTHKNISLYFKRRYLTIHNYCGFSV